MTIPKIVHQIWIGPNARPDIWMDTVRKFCADFGYEYKFWGETEIDNFNLTNRTQYDNMTFLCGKADIVRYEVLYKYGGVYIDADSVILKPESLDTLISTTNEDCVFGDENSEERIANGVIFSIPESIMMKECISRIPFRNLWLHPFMCTGPRLITDIKNEMNLNIKIFPHEVFYPYGWHSSKTINHHETLTFPEESVMYQYGYCSSELSSKVNLFYETNIQ